MFPLNLPNALTLGRILVVPVLVVALTVETPGGSTIAAVVFAVAALTDAAGRLHRPLAARSHDLRQGDGPGGGQAS